MISLITILQELKINTPNKIIKGHHYKIKDKDGLWDGVWEAATDQSGNVNGDILMYYVPYSSSEKYWRWGLNSGKLPIKSDPLYIHSDKIENFTFIPISKKDY